MNWVGGVPVSARHHWRSPDSVPHLHVFITPKHGQLSRLWHIYVCELPSLPTLPSFLWLVCIIFSLEKMGSFSARYNRLACIKGAAYSKNPCQFHHSFRPFSSLKEVFLLGGLDVILLDHLLSFIAGFNGASNVWPTVLEDEMSWPWRTSMNPFFSYTQTHLWKHMCTIHSNMTHKLSNIVNGWTMDKKGI